MPSINATSPEKSGVFLFMNYGIGTWANVDVSVCFSFSLATSQSKGVSGAEETWVSEGNFSRLSEESRLDLWR